MELVIWGIPALIALCCVWGVFHMFKDDDEEDADQQ